MYVMLVDEGSVASTGRRAFFVCGGAVFPAESMHTLHSAVEEIRKTAGYRREDSLKFSTNERPGNVSREKAAEAKAAVLDLCREEGCFFLAYAVNYEWAKHTSKQRLWYWGIHTVIQRFYGFLHEKDDVGICLLDRPPSLIGNSQAFQLIEKLYLKGGDENLTGRHDYRGRFPHIALFGLTGNNASGLSSIADILVGGFRWCVNDRNNDVALEEMFPELVTLMWHKELNHKKCVRGLGLTVRRPEPPITLDAIREAYEEFDGFLDEVKPEGWDILVPVPWETPIPQEGSGDRH